MNGCQFDISIKQNPVFNSKGAAGTGSRQVTSERGEPRQTEAFFVVCLCVFGESGSDYIEGLSTELNGPFLAIL